MNQRYIVRDRNGAYQSAYNLAFGKDKAYDWAKQCAKSVGGIVYFMEGDDAKEQEVFRVPDAKKN
jgi:hypothetical protein